MERDMRPITSVAEAAYSPSLFAGLSGRHVPRIGSGGAPHPLVVALHGGTYSSRYFDVPGYSLLARAAALEIPVLAPDRSGYGESPLLPNGGGTLRDNADFLAGAIGDGWRAHGAGAAGIVLIGHSIGGGIALMIAAQALDWPLLGVAVSGVGLHTPDESRAAWAALPDMVHVDLPPPVKDQVMFGPPGSYAGDMPGLSHLADAPVPRTEIVDIVETWHLDAPDVLARIRVPVHYRQAEFDRLWIVDDGEVSGFARALGASPRVDWAMQRGAGHCIDFHLDGVGFQVQQLGFALQCAAQAR